MHETTIDPEAMGCLAKALIFVCGAGHPTTLAQTTEQIMRAAKKRRDLIRAAARESILCVEKNWPHLRIGLWFGERPVRQEQVGLSRQQICQAILHGTPPLETCRSGGCPFASRPPPWRARTALVSRVCSGVGRTTRRAARIAAR